MNSNVGKWNPLDINWSCWIFVCWAASLTWQPTPLSLPLIPSCNPHLHFGDRLAVQRNDNLPLTLSYYQPCLVVIGISDGQEWEFGREGGVITANNWTGGHRGGVLGLGGQIVTPYPLHLGACLTACVGSCGINGWVGCVKTQQGCIQKGVSLQLRQRDVFQTLINELFVQSLHCVSATWIKQIKTDCSLMNSQLQYNYYIVWIHSWWLVIKDYIGTWA